MVFLFFHNVIVKKTFLSKPTFLGSWDFGKKVQKGPTASKHIFFLKVVGEQLIFWSFCFVGYQRVFWVPLGGSDGYSPVGLHTDLSTTRSQVRIPPPAGRRGEINHNKSEKSIINQWINYTTMKIIQKGQKRSKKVQRPQNRFVFWRWWWVNSEGVR